MREPLSKEEHKLRLDKLKPILKNASDIVERIKVSVALNGCAFSQAQNAHNMNEELRYKTLKEKYNLYLEEAIEDGFIELAI